MDEPYTIGIRLALEDGVSTGMAALSGQMRMLDRAMAGMASLRGFGADGRGPAAAAQAVARVGAAEVAPTAAPVPEMPMAAGRTLPERVEREPGAVAPLAMTPVQPFAVAPAPVVAPAEARAPAPMVPPQPAAPTPVAASDNSPQERMIPAAPVVLSQIQAPAAPTAVQQVPAPFLRHAASENTNNVPQFHAPTAEVGGSAPALAPALASALPQAAPQGGGNSAGGSPGGDVYLDGRLMGRWMADQLARGAGRPQGGTVGFDGRMGPAWPGALQGGG